MYRKMLLFMLLFFFMFGLCGCVVSDSVKGLTYRVTVTDCTNGRNFNPELWAYKPGSWHPDMSGGSDSINFGPFPEGEQSEIYFYPDGRHGEEMILLVKEGKNVNIDICDDRILVSGDAVMGHRVNWCNEGSLLENGLELKVTVFDLTEKRSPGIEIWMHGFDWWYPDLSFGESAKVYAGIPAGEARELYIYPDGKNGHEMMVVVVLKSTSGEDTLNIKVYDKKVNVWGTALLLSYVSGNEADFKR